MKKKIVIFFTFFILFSIATSLRRIDMDGIFCYGFSYNIAKGLLPYKNFNMVIGPIYSILFCPLLKIFGNYYFLFKIEHNLMYSFVFTKLYEKLKFKSIFIFLIFCTADTIFGYNAFVLGLLILILLLEESSFKQKNIIIGILIGLIIMTKQNIGLCLLIVYIFINRKNIKVCLSPLISIIPVIIYLLITKTFISYIDFCYLGLGSFFDNFYIDINSIIGYLIFLIPLTYIVIKNKTKRKSLLYVIAFQSVGIPIFDRGHILLGMIPIVYFILTEENNYIIECYVKTLTVALYIFFTITSIINTKYITDNNFLKYERIYKGMPKYLKEISKYIDADKDVKVYLLMENAYLIKLYRGQTLGFYDIINKGNMGTKDKYYIDQMDKNCKDKKCMFVLDSNFYNDVYYQGIEGFKKYAEENGNYLETLPSNERVYINYNKN